METDVHKKEQMSKDKLVEELEAEQLILRLFFIDPYTEFSLSEVAELIGKSKSLVSKKLGPLQDEELITVIKKRYVYRIQANYSNFQYIKRKILYNLDAIYRSGIVELLVEVYPKAKAIIFFGSARKGEDAAGSDIDIAIETEEDPVDISAEPETKALEDYLDRHLSTFVFDRESLSEGSFSNIANGIVLYGYLEANP